MFENVIASDIEFTEWKKVRYNEKNRCKQVQSTMPKEKVEAFSKQAQEFDAHVQRVKKNQYAEMRGLRENLKDGEVMIWMDFAENFTCSTVKESQSAH